MIFDFDDWSQAHDCRMELEKLKEINPKFKVTLFTIPAKTTIEMLEWANWNNYWVELAQHGWKHNSNYECKDWDFETAMYYLSRGVLLNPKGFKAPGWQISDDLYHACREFGYYVADQPYNKDRRPEGVRIYEVGKDAYHGHTWDCNCGNGIHEDWDNIVKKVKEAKEFKFISEVV